MVVTLVVRYSLWHYTQAPRLWFFIWRNLLWYIGHVFSVSTLWRSLFAPWKRIVSKSTKRWDFEDIASSLLANLISRLIGALMRLFLIFTGRFMQLLWLGFGLVFYVGWFLMPFVLFSLFSYGLSLVL